MTKSRIAPQWGLPARVCAMEACATELVDPDCGFDLVFCKERAEKDSLHL